MNPLAIGVTTWSVQIPEDNFGEILRKIKEDINLDVIQLGAWAKVELTKKVQEQWLEAIHKFGMEVSATCVAFLGEDYSTFESAIATIGFYDPKYFEPRYKHLCDMAELTTHLGVDLLTTHMGYVPHEVTSPKYSHMLDVTKRIADMLGEKGISLGMEVGGLETADDLLQFIEHSNCSNLKINYDPANLLRGGKGDPIEGLEVLRDHVVHVHLKDANAPTVPGLFGLETQLNEGGVGIERFVNKLKEIGYKGPLVIEREGGKDPAGDIRNSAALLRSLI